MNPKFVLFSLAVVAALQLASAASVTYLDLESQSAAVPTNDEETAALTGKAVVFSDFCISSRDYVVKNVKQTTNGLAANVFTLFFSTAENIASSGLDASRSAVDRLGTQVRVPESPIARSASGGEVDSIIADGQQKIQETQIQPRSLVQAILSTLQATRTAVANAVLQRLNYIKSNFGPSSLIFAVQSACEQVQKYENAIRKEFTQTRDQLAEVDPEVAKFQFENVPCVTSRRIIRFDGICKLARAAQGPVQQIIYKPSQ